MREPPHPLALQMQGAASSWAGCSQPWLRGTPSPLLTLKAEAGSLSIQLVKPSNQGEMHCAVNTDRDRFDSCGFSFMPDGSSGRDALPITASLRVRLLYQVLGRVGLPRGNKH